MIIYAWAHTSTYLFLLGGLQWVPKTDRWRLICRVLLFVTAPQHGKRSVRERDGLEEMADGVDHIDIYADVEEEFNQVFGLHLLYCGPLVICAPTVLQQRPTNCVFWWSNDPLSR